MASIHTQEHTTSELRIEQAEREAYERRALAASELPEEARQHERRLEKAAYLRRKLAERERVERRG